MLVSAGRLRDEDGFTLMELMTAMVIGSVVLTALMTIFINGLTSASRVTDRVEAAQRGRVAMDRVTSLLDSQVCIVNYDAAAGTEVWVSPVIAGSDDNTATFYGDLSGASDTPDKYQLAYSTTKKTLTEYRYDGSGKLPNVTFPGWPNAPTVKRVIATDIVPARAGGVSTGAQLPIFQYRRFTGGDVDPTVLATPLSATDAATVIRVDVQFQAVPQRTKTEDPRSAQLTGQGNVLTANPVNNTVC